MLLWKQSKASPKRGIPADLTSVAKTLKSITAETIQLYYNNAWTLTVDAWQAAWVVVVWKLANSWILDAIGYKLWEKW